MFLLVHFLPIMAFTYVSRGAEAKFVFAHFIVGNANSNSIAEWTNDIQLAQAAHIDGFALNIAAEDPSNAASLSNAFKAANNLINSGQGDFRLFFSFDYAAWGTWSQSAVISLLRTYGPNGAYFHFNGQPFVSTFEGSGNAGDWTKIKQQTGCFFIPDWTSLGASAAAAITGTDGQLIADGLFSWDAWPEGANDMTTDGDNSFISALGSRPYMMPVSPWFFTDLPGYSKNWAWRGDDLWYDRWQQVLSINPQFVEIITWNDFGESHYIGPLRSDNFGLFGPNAGNAPYNYAANMPHDAFRTFLPYVIDTYKNGYPPAIPSEQVVTWYRVNPNTACSSGGTTGNNPSYQTPVSPTTVLIDAVYYSALLTSDASVSVTIGGTTVVGSWRNIPAGGSGIYHGRVPFNGLTGSVTVAISRQPGTVMQVVGVPITTDCEASAGQVNWNAWTGASCLTPE